jgi:hypothetical protein
MELSFFELTDKIATYLKARFLWHLDGKRLPPGPLPSEDLDVDLITDIELLAHQAANAFQNRGLYLCFSVMFEIRAISSSGSLGCG